MRNSQARGTPVDPYIRKVALMQLVVAFIGLPFFWTSVYAPVQAVALVGGIVCSCITLKYCLCCTETEASYINCTKALNVFNIICATVGIFVSGVFFLVWTIIAISGPQFGEGYYENDVYYYNPGYCAEVLRQEKEVSLDSSMGRARMVVLLTDGFATEGNVTDSMEIARMARKKTVKARFPVSVHGLAFGKGADLEGLKLLSAGSGGIATRIYDDADMDTQVELFFESVGSPLMTNLSFSYTALADKTCSPTDSACAMSCALVKGDVAPGGACSLTQQPQTSLYDGSTVVQAGRLPLIQSRRAQALRVSVRGRRKMEVGAEDDAYEITHTFGAADASPAVLSGDSTASVKKIWAQMAVAHAVAACPQGSLYKNSAASQGKNPSSEAVSAAESEMYGEDPDFQRDAGCALGVKGGSAGLLALAKAAALEAQIVTPYTSLVTTSRKIASANCTSVNTNTTCNVSSESAATGEDEHEALVCMPNSHG
jgi:hypothetical protein